MAVVAHSREGDLLLSGEADSLGALEGQPPGWIAGLMVVVPRCVCRLLSGGSNSVALPVTVAVAPRGIAGNGEERCGIGVFEQDRSSKE